MATAFRLGRRCTAVCLQQRPWAQTQRGPRFTFGGWSGRRPGKGPDSRSEAMGLLRWGHQRFLSSARKNAISIGGAGNARGRPGGTGGRNRRSPPVTTAAMLPEISIHEQLDKLYHSLQEGLSSMSVEVTREEGGAIYVDTKSDSGGVVIIQPDALDPNLISMMSPASSTFRYQWKSDDTFSCVEDGHDLVGLLCRDLLWNCSGIPKF